MRTLLASGALLATIALAVTLGVAVGYALIHGLLRLLVWLRPAPEAAPERERAGVAGAVGAD